MAKTETTMGSLLKSYSPFLHMTGEDAIEIYDTFIFTDNEKGKNQHTHRKIWGALLSQENCHMREVQIHKTADHSMSSLSTYEVDQKRASLESFKTA